MNKNNFLKLVNSYALCGYSLKQFANVYNVLKTFMK